MEILSGILFIVGVELIFILSAIIICRRSDEAWSKLDSDYRGIRKHCLRT